MSKTWYPVINYENCIECGACTNKCKHEVYNLEKAPIPVVVNPEGCVQGCHGCANLCPSDAIQYVGDFNQKNENCCCSCEPERDHDCNSKCDCNCGCGNGECCK